MPEAVYVHHRHASAALSRLGRELQTAVSCCAGAKNATQGLGKSNVGS